MEKQTISIRVPATVGNFCGAADCGALALDASLNVKITRRLDGRVNIRYFGENGDRVPRDRSNLVVRAIEAALHLKQREFTGADFEIYSSVPVGVGIGSSTAAVLAGLIGANGLYRLALDEKTLFDLAAIYESRAGNLYAAWSGGFAAGVQDSTALGHRSAAAQPFVQATVPFIEKRAPAPRIDKTTSEPFAAALFVYKRTIVPENFILNVVVPETSLVPGDRGNVGKPAGVAAGGIVHFARRASARAALRQSGMPGSYADPATDLRLNRAAALAEFFAQQGNGNSIELDRTLPPTCEKNVAGLEEALQVRTPGLLSVFVCGSGPAVGVFAAENSAEAVRAVREIFARHQVASTCFEFRASNAGAVDWNGIPHDVTLAAGQGLGYSAPKPNSLPV